MSSNSAFVPEVQGQAKVLSLLIAQSVREYFKDEETGRNLSNGMSRDTVRNINGHL